MQQHAIRPLTQVFILVVLHFVNFAKGVNVLIDDAPQPFEHVSTTLHSWQEENDTTHDCTNTIIIQRSGVLMNALGLIYDIHNSEF